jgi:hypothetical protein
MPHAIMKTSANFSEVIIEPYGDITRIRFIAQNGSGDHCLALEMTYYKVHRRIDTRFESTTHRNRDDFEEWIKSTAVQTEMNAILQDYAGGRDLPAYVQTRPASILCVESDSEDDGPGSSLRTSSATQASASGMSKGMS